MAKTTTEPSAFVLVTAVGKPYLNPHGLFMVTVTMACGHKKEVMAQAESVPVIGVVYYCHRCQDEIDQQAGVNRYDKMSKRPAIHYPLQPTKTETRRMLAVKDFVDWMVMNKLRFYRGELDPSKLINIEELRTKDVFTSYRQHLDRVRYRARHST